LVWLLLRQLPSTWNFHINSFIHLNQDFYASFSVTDPICGVAFFAPLHSSILLL
jgi:hypothetical protein